MSKHVTFLIGNGFDLNVGLRTRYTDFYKVYTETKPSDSNVIQRFKREIMRSEAHGWRDWKDFELGMGKQSKLFSGETQSEDFIECFNDFAVCFNKYLIDECARINWDVVDDALCRPFVLSIRSFYSHITTFSRETLQQRITHNHAETANVHFLQFNYTDIFGSCHRIVETSSILPKKNVLINVPTTAL